MVKVVDGIQVFVIGVVVNNFEMQCHRFLLANIKCNKMRELLTFMIVLANAGPRCWVVVLVFSAYF